MKRNQAIILSVCGVLLVAIVLMNLNWEPSAEALATRALTASDPETRKQAMVLLTMRKPQSSLVPLRRVLAESQDPEVLYAAISSLGPMLDAESRPLLLDDMNHSSEVVRWGAYLAVLRFYGGSKLPDGLDYDWNDPPETRQKVIDRLKQLSAGTPGEALSDKHKSTKDKASSKDHDKDGAPK